MQQRIPRLGLSLGHYITLGPPGHRATPLGYILRKKIYQQGAYRQKLSYQYMMTSTNHQYLSAAKDTTFIDLPVQDETKTSAAEETQA